MTLPRYCIVGIRPVKLVTNDEGEMDVRAYQWETGKFARDLSFLSTVVFAEDPDVDIVGEDAFKAQVSGLRRELKKKWKAAGRA